MTMVEKRVMLLGAGYFAQEATDLAEDISGVRVVAYAVNQGPHQPGQTLLGRPVYWIDDLPELLDQGLLVCSAIVSTLRAGFVEQVEALGFPFVTLVHPSARVSRTAVLGPGTLISSGVQIAAYTSLGSHVVVNRGALIGHHTTIGDFNSIGPGAILAGSVKTGARAWIGLGAKILQHRRIGERAVVVAGSLVSQDVPERTKVIGSPAQVIQQEIEGY
jgi:sugar O-acyltransferase (sialic acid O-acetyltransferase NeuD family)